MGLTSLLKFKVSACKKMGNRANIRYFMKISVSDNGEKMSFKVIVYVIQHALIIVFFV